LSSLLGWLGPAPERADVLQAMAGACGLPQSPLQTFAAEDFAVAATSPVGGSQPQRLATSDDGQVVVAFAGQLYDEDVTRKQQPAAYCLQLYQCHGVGFARHLNGTFAVAVYDRSAEQLHLITDRMASRGLYYHTASPLVFGTEVKFLLEYPGVSRRVNPDRLREFLAFEFLPGTATYYDHIRQVPSATVLTWQNGRSSATDCDRAEELGAPRVRGA
jgi:asparagine synthase (glutamine-hydrolysing)